MLDGEVRCQVSLSVKSIKVNKPFIDYEDGVSYAVIVQRGSVQSDLKMVDLPTERSAGSFQQIKVPVSLDFNF